MAKKNKLLTFDVNAEAEDLAQQLVCETFKLLDILEKQSGAGQLPSKFLACFIGALVFRQLSAKLPSSMGQEEKYKIACKNFTNVKSAAQDAVAAGFSGAMSSYSGMSVEYYCQVKAVPEAANKEPC